jgi:hypothetical protein
MSRLVRDEIRLAQKEFQQSAKHAGIGAGLFAFIGAGIAALIGRKQADEVTPAAPRTVETVKADIERTRNELGETVQALSGKLDVKERAKEAVSARADTLKHAATDNPKQTVRSPQSGSSQRRHLRS